MKGKYSPGWTVSSECLLFAFVVVGYLEKIHDLYNLVMVLDALLAVFSFFYVILWFFLRREYYPNPVSTSLTVMTLVILVSSVVGKSDSTRLMVAAFALLESWALAIAVIVLKRQRQSILVPVYAFIIAFSVFYSVLSLVMGMESGETRYNGLSNQSNSLAVVAASSLLIALSLMGRKKGIISTVTANIALLLSSLLFAYTLKMTDSRTSYFALITALCFFLVFSLLHSKNRLSVILVSAVAIAAIAVTVVYLLSSSRSARSETLASLTSGRTTIWTETLSRMEAEEYLFGFGGNSASMASSLEERGMSAALASYLGEKHLMHSIYIQFIVEYGVVSAAAFTFGAVFLFISSFGTMRRERESVSSVLPSAVLMIFFLVHASAESSIYFIGGSEQILFILSSAVVYSFYRERRNGK